MALQPILNYFTRYIFKSVLNQKQQTFKDTSDTTTQSSTESSDTSSDRTSVDNTTTDDSLEYANLEYTESSAKTFDEYIKGYEEFAAHYKIIDGKGSLFFRVKTFDELYEENKRLLNRIHELIGFTNPVYEKYLEPLLNRFIKTVSIAPASQCSHDPDSGGLLRHSLLTAIKLLEKASDFRYDGTYKNFEAFQCYLLILGLMHDIGKLKTDYVITTPNEKYKFSMEKPTNTIDNFIRKTKTRYLKIRFKPRRNLQHDLVYRSSIVFLLSDSYELFEFLAQNLDRTLVETLSYGALTDTVRKALKGADGLACHTSISKFHSLYEIGAYLTSMLLSDEIDKSKSGFYKFKHGYLIELGSDAYRELVLAFDSYYKAMYKYSRIKDENYFRFTYSNEETNPVKFEIDELSNKFPATVLEGPRESIFKKLAGTSFFTRKAYMNGCSWNQITSDTESKMVYGFFVELFEDPSAQYTVTDEFKNRNIYKSLASLNYDNYKDITSFTLKNGCFGNDLINDSDNAEKYIELDSIKFNEFSEMRRIESKEKTKRNRVAKRKANAEHKYVGMRSFLLPPKTDEPKDKYVI